MAWLSLTTCFILLLYIGAGFAKNPNIVFILTDDQDVFSGMNHIPKAKKYIGEEGITFDNMFVTTPICCPSRMSIMTGRYTHNHHGYNNSISGGCGDKFWMDNMEPYAFAAYIKKLQNYNTFFAGKYVNSYGDPESEGGDHIPPGWDDWNGLYGNSKYYNYKLSVNGVEEKHGEQEEDYFTDLIGRRAYKFIEKQTSEGPPFLVMMATPASHVPDTPSTKYQHSFENETAPRHPNYNVHGYDKHWLVSSAKTPMSPDVVKSTDELYVHRTQTLLSVDDIVDDVVNLLERKNMLNNTYILYSSDNGFHLGQFSLPYDKRHLYEFDIRVPFMIRGPGIKPKQVRKETILNIDFAPTFLKMAGITPPEHMDGQSFLPILHSDGNLEPESWRKDFMVEYWGQSNPGPYPKCPQLSYQPVTACNQDCTCIDSRNNTYSCVRTLSRSENLIYCKFHDDVGFVEFYDIASDPYQFHKLASTADQKTLDQQEKRRQQLFQCQGQGCHQILPESDFLQSPNIDIL